MEEGSSLPPEVMEEILLRLPYKSLSRFKCVCKFWYSLFTSPNFLPPHLSQFIEHHSNNSAILGISFPFKLYSLPSNDSSFVDTLSPITDMSSAARFQILGHCDGILCLSLGLGYWRGDMNIILYNPATREFKCLPDSVVRTHSSFTLTVALGYDSRHDDYRVLMIRRKTEFSGYVTNGVEEYSLTTDSWTPLCIRNAGDFHFEQGCFALFFKGTYYWWPSKPNWEFFSSTNYSILRLKVGDEVFDRMAVPREVDMIRNHSRRKLVVWKDSLSLICCNELGPIMSRINIWVMDGFEAQVSWTKMHSITTLFEAPRPLVFWKGKELLLETCNGEIASCNVDSGEIKKFSIQGNENPSQGSTQAVNYVATLVSTKGGTYLP